MSSFKKIPFDLKKKHVQSEDIVNYNRSIIQFQCIFVLKKHKFQAIAPIKSVLAPISLKFYVTRGYLFTENKTETCTMLTNHITVVTNYVVNL